MFLSVTGEGELCDSVGTEPATVPPGVVAQYYHYTNTCHPGLVCTNSACAQPQAKDRTYVLLIFLRQV